jgi:hypothetical protein
MNSVLGIAFQWACIAFVLIVLAQNGVFEEAMILLTVVLLVWAYRANSSRDSTRAVTGGKFEEPSYRGDVDDDDDGG